MSCRKTVFPFTAIVGQEKMKKALILNAINPNVGGVLIRGEKGTAKSTAARGLAYLLPEIDVVADCKFRCNPDIKQEMCAECWNRKEKGEELPVVKRKMEVVDLPLGATEDRVVGTLDIERAIKKGEKHFEPGILAEAHRGILYVDEVNLLDDHLVDVLLDAAAMGVNIVEREGVSFSHPSRFILVGTMNPEEGELRPQLLDRFGLCVDVQGIANQRERREVVERWLDYERNPHGFEEKWRQEQDRLCRLILKAKGLLPNVTYSPEILDLITQIALDMGVDGHRADIFMLKAAHTISAYHERTEITEDDVREAAELVLPHRMPKRPFQESKVDQEKLEQSIQRQRNKQKAKGEEQEETRGDQNSHRNREHKEPQKGGSETNFEVGDPFQVKKLNLPLDRQPKRGSGRRSKARTDTKWGRYVGSTILKDKHRDVALDATLRAAAPHQIYRERGGNAVAIEPPDLRQKIREKKIGTTILFVVDASGSMGANRRMVETKGAILSLLIDAYQRRDKVGLIAFKGSEARLLLPPTSSVEVAKKQLEELPVGGKTPLSYGLKLAFEVLKKEKQRQTKPLLILISDGKPNVSIWGGDPLEEAKSIAIEIKKLGVSSLVIDSENGFITFGRSKEICKSLDGKYYKMEDLKAQQIVYTVRELVN
ncbi:MAG TPA: putative cobaltochelatase [Syntrophaceae bacterium]|nr:putative cobaltochelatase [Syntrophaceae bacterium]